MKIDHAGKGREKNTFLLAEKGKKCLPPYNCEFSEQGVFVVVVVPPPPAASPVPHSSSGVGALDPALPQETIRIISNWAERKWNFK